MTRLLTLLFVVAMVTVGCSAASGGDEQSLDQLQFSAPTLSGETLDTSTVVGEKPAAFWVWAPWCPTCNQEAPVVVEAFEKYGDSVQFLEELKQGTNQ